MIQAIDRAAQVLFLLEGSKHLRISELSAALGLPPSTVHGIVKSLQHHGLVVKEPNGPMYMLGPALLRLSNVYLDSSEVRGRAMQWTRELAKRTTLSVRLGAPLFDDVIIIHHNRRPDGTQQMPETGQTIPLHATSMGKIFLAYNDALADDRLGRDMPALTADTITDPDVMRIQLARITERGIAVDEEEAVIGESSVAAPLADRTGAVVAAVSVVMPSSEFPPGDSVLNDLRETARTISRSLGALAWPPAPLSSVDE